MYQSLYRRPQLRRPPLSPAPGSGIQPLTPLSPQQILDGRPGAAVDEMQPVNNAGTVVNQQLEKNRALDAISFVGRDQPTAVPTTTVPTAMGSGFKRLAAGVGQNIKENPIGAANGLLGAAGAIINASAKTPALPAYQDFVPSVAPATGMNTGVKQQLLNRITQNQLRAGQAQGPDANLTAATRLQAASTAGEQQQQVEQQDQTILQQQQQRNQDIVNQAGQVNQQGREQRKVMGFEQAQRQAETRRATGTAMVQGAATYFTQAEASKRQDAQTALQQQYSRDTSQKQARYQQLLMSKASGNLTPQQSALINQQLAALEAESTAAPSRSISTTVKRRFGGRVPVALFAAGGKASASYEVSTGRTSKAPDPAAQMTQLFRRSMEKVTQQAMQNFAATMRQVQAARMQPISGRR